MKNSELKKHANKVINFLYYNQIYLKVLILGLGVIFFIVAGGNYLDDLNEFKGGSKW